MCASVCACWVKKAWDPGAKYVRHVIRAAFSDMLQLISTHTHNTPFFVQYAYTPTLRGCSNTACWSQRTKSAVTNFATVLHNEVYKIIKQFRDYCESLRLVKGLRSVKWHTSCLVSLKQLIAAISAPVFFFFGHFATLSLCACVSAAGVLPKVTSLRPAECLSWHCINITMALTELLPRWL